MNFRFWDRKKVEPDAALKRAMEERKHSERRLEESRSKLDYLKEMQRQNHVGEMLDQLITRRQRRIRHEFRGSP